MQTAIQFLLAFYSSTFFQASSQETLRYPLSNPVGVKIEKVEVSLKQQSDGWPNIYVLMSSVTYRFTHGPGKVDTLIVITPYGRGAQPFNQAEPTPNNYQYSLTVSGALPGRATPPDSMQVTIGLKGTFREMRLFANDTDFSWSYTTWVRTERIPMPQPPLPDIAGTYDSVAVAGYVIKGSVEAPYTEDERSVITISKDGHLLREFPNVPIDPDWNNFKVESLLGKGSKQLIIEQYSGGAHCCWTYFILDLSANLHVIYDDSIYSDLERDMVFKDIDGDGVTEIIRPVGIFDYFAYLSHVESPFPLVVLKYSDERHRYAVANKLFKKFLMSGMDESIAAVRECHSDTSSDKAADTSETCYSPERARGDRCFPEILSVMLQYIYAGDRDTGWAFFDKWYSGIDKEDMRTKIHLALAGTPVYTELYK